MTPKQYQSAIDKLDLSQGKAGLFLGYTPRQSRRIVAGDAEAPLSAVKLLRVMLKLGLSVDQVNEISGV